MRRQGLWECRDCQGQGHKRTYSLTVREHYYNDNASNSFHFSAALVPVRIEAATVPLEFRRLQTDRLADGYLIVFVNLNQTDEIDSHEYKCLILDFVK